MSWLLPWQDKILSGSHYLSKVEQLNGFFKIVYCIDREKLRYLPREKLDFVSEDPSRAEERLSAAWYTEGGQSLCCVVSMVSTPSSDVECHSVLWIVVVGLLNTKERSFVFQRGFSE